MHDIRFDFGNTSNTLFSPVYWNLTIRGFF